MHHNVLYDDLDHKSRWKNGSARDARGRRLLHCTIRCCIIHLRGFSSSSFGIPSLSRWRFNKRHRSFFAYLSYRPARSCLDAPKVLALQVPLQQMPDRTSCLTRNRFGALAVPMRFSANFSTTHSNCAACCAYLAMPAADSVRLHPGTILECQSSAEGPT
jgi:hypothetical protein